MMNYLEIDCFIVINLETIEYKFVCMRLIKGTSHEELIYNSMGGNEIDIMKI